MALGDVLVGDAADIAASLGERARAIELDVTSERSWSGAVDATRACFGPVTVLVNNAGVMRPNAVDEGTLADYRAVIDVNQVGPYLGMRAVVGDMRAAGGGSIVNVSSVGALAGMPGAIAYAAAKSAVRGMSRSASVELGPDRIRVNAVFPGPISTSMLPFPPDSFGFLPLGRSGAPEEVASVIVHLASDESRFVTGAEHVVDGGLMAMNPAANRGVARSNLGQSNA